MITLDSSIQELFYQFGLSSKQELDESSLDEALITFGGKAYPPFGQIVILSGGAGSGKGFVKSNLLGIEGISLDVDRLKELVMHSTKYNEKIKEMFGIDASKLNLKKPEDVGKLHDVVDKLSINDRKLKALFTSIISADPTRKPNLIFDVTLKDLNKFYNTLRRVEEMGYWKQNISLVWVLNTIDVSQAQNKGRNRVVPEDILLATHQGASYTMSEILKMGDKLSQYMDGDLYVAFNQEKVDSTVVKGNQQSDDEEGAIFKNRPSKPMYVKEADYIQLKKKQQPLIKFEDIEADIIKKIKRYVPNAIVWNRD